MSWWIFSAIPTHFGGRCRFGLKFIDFCTLQYPGCLAFEHGSMAEIHLTLVAQGRRRFGSVAQWRWCRPTWQPTNPLLSSRPLATSTLAVLATARPQGTLSDPVLIWFWPLAPTTKVTRPLFSSLFSENPPLVHQPRLHYPVTVVRTQCLNVWFPRRPVDGLRIHLKPSMLVMTGVMFTNSSLMTGRCQAAWKKACHQPNFKY